MRIITNKYGISQKILYALIDAIASFFVLNGKDVIEEGFETFSKQGSRSSCGWNEPTSSQNSFVSSCSTRLQFAIASFFVLNGTDVIEEGFETLSKQGSRSSCGWNDPTSTQLSQNSFVRSCSTRLQFMVASARLYTGII
jgi:hypothetical protein